MILIIITTVLNANTYYIIGICCSSLALVSVTTQHAEFDRDLFGAILRKFQENLRVFQKIPSVFQGKMKGLSRKCSVGLKGI